MTVEEYIDILERYYRIPENVKKDLKNCRAGVESELGNFEKNDIKKVVEDYCLDVDPKFFPKLGYVVARLERNIIQAGDVESFVETWNSFVFDRIKSADHFSQVVAATPENVKEYATDCKKEILKIMDNTQKMINNCRKPYIPIRGVSMDNPWLFGMTMLTKRRFYSDFLYNTCMISPKFFCDHVKEIVDPFSPGYLNDNEKYPHD